LNQGIVGALLDLVAAVAAFLDLTVAAACAILAFLHEHDSANSQMLHFDASVISTPRAGRSPRHHCISLAT
jgi:hypothetical protein